MIILIIVLIICFIILSLITIYGIFNKTENPIFQKNYFKEKGGGEGKILNKNTDLEIYLKICPDGTVIIKLGFLSDLPSDKSRQFEFTPIGDDLYVSNYIDEAKKHVNNIFGLYDNNNIGIALDNDGCLWYHMTIYLTFNDIPTDIKTFKDDDMKLSESSLTGLAEVIGHFTLLDIIRKNYSNKPIIAMSDANFIDIDTDGKTIYEKVLNYSNKTDTNIGETTNTNKIGYNFKSVENVVKMLGVDCEFYIFQLNEGIGADSVLNIFNIFLNELYNNFITIINGGAIVFGEIFAETTFSMDESVFSSFKPKDKDIKESFINIIKDRYNSIKEREQTNDIIKLFYTNIIPVYFIKRTTDKGALIKSLVSVPDGNNIKRYGRRLRAKLNKYNFSLPSIPATPIEDPIETKEELDQIAAEQINDELNELTNKGISEDSLYDDETITSILNSDDFDDIMDNNILLSSVLKYKFLYDILGENLTEEHINIFL